MFLSPVKNEKITRNNTITTNMVKCRRNVNFEEMFTERLTGKKKRILITFKNTSGVYQTKYYYGIIKKSKFSFLKEQQKKMFSKLFSA